MDEITIVKNLLLENTCENCCRKIHVAFSSDPERWCFVYEQQPAENTCPFWQKIYGRFRIS